MMLEDKEKNYLEWFKKAEEDELSADAILKAGGASSTACFLSQQIAEKYLKGLLVFNDKPFPKVHDLLELETLVLDLTPEIKDYEEDLDLLSTYYIETCYPGDYPEFSRKEAEEALISARKIKEFVLRKIKS